MQRAHNSTKRVPLRFYFHETIAAATAARNPSFNRHTHAHTNTYTTNNIEQSYKHTNGAYTLTRMKQQHRKCITVCVCTTFSFLFIFSLNLYHKTTSYIELCSRRPNQNAKELTHSLCMCACVLSRNANTPRDRENEKQMPIFGITKKRDAKRVHEQQNEHKRFELPNMYVNVLCCAVFNRKTLVHSVSLSSSRVVNHSNMV